MHTAGDSRSAKTYDPRVDASEGIATDFGEQLSLISKLFESVVNTVAKVILVDRATVELAVAAVMAEGHLLIEDHPGLGKTTMAKSLAAAVGLDFHRIQCTADLLPADVVGALVLDPTSQKPEFRPGPIFANIVLADELNRASPRSQSAFLEAMGERQVTVDGVTYALPRPFIVFATQNPFEDPGTMQLPFGQRDRFLIRLSIGYPTPAREHELLIHGDRSELIDDIAPISKDDLAAMQSAARSVHVSPSVADYALALLEATRCHGSVQVGGSPRAGLALVRTAGALAVGRGRDYISPDEIQTAAGPVLGHRILLTTEATLRGAEPHDVVDEVLRSVPVIDDTEPRAR
jgi:MoxR-like ATPase